MIKKTVDYSFRKIASRWIAGLLTASLFLGLGCNEPKYLSRGISSWERDLDAAESYKRRQACEALATFGEKAAKSVDALEAALNDVDPSVQIFAADALAKIGLEGHQKLESALSSMDALIRLNAAKALTSVAFSKQTKTETKVSVEDKLIEAALTEMAKAMSATGDKSIARDAQDALVRLKENALPAVIPFLSNRIAPVRKTALLTILRMESAARSAEKEVQKLLADKDVEVRTQAVRTLARISDADALEPLLNDLVKKEIEDEDVAVTAAHMLKFIGKRTSASGYETEETATQVEEKK